MNIFDKLRTNVFSWKLLLYGIILHADCIMTMTQRITLLYVLTSSLLSTFAPFDSNNSTACKWPLSDALHKRVSPHYNNKNQ